MTKRFFPYVLCVLASFFYLYEFILRVAPNTMTAQLMHAFSLRGLGFGTLAASYLYAYTPMQIPAGLLIDRFGPRRLMTWMLLLCGTATFFFGMAEGLGLATFARFWIGFGCSFGFIGPLVLISRWCPPKHFALMTGVTQFLGSLGAIFGLVPLAAGVTYIGWRSTTYLTGAIGIGLAILIWKVVRDYPQDKPATKSHTDEPISSVVRQVYRVIKNPQTWWIAACGFSAWTAISVFATTWGVSFIRIAYHMSNINASAAVAWIWWGVALGSPLVGWVSDQWYRRCLPIALCSILGVLSTACVIYCTNMPSSLLHVMLLMFGMGAGGQIISFALVKENNRPEVVGTAIGINNMAVVFGGLLFQPLVGYLLNFYWDGTLRRGVPVFQLSDYQHALLVVPIIASIAFFLSLTVVKETRCQDQYSLISKKASPDTA